MRHLFGVEMTRLRWRRAVLFLMLAAIAIPLLIAIGTAWDTRSVSDSDISNAQTMIDRDIANSKKEIARCLKNPDRFGLQDSKDSADLEQQCGEATGYGEEPQIEWYLDRAPLDLKQVVHDGGTGAAVILAMLALLIGTTFAGADWASGSMSNQLLFEPRRTRVWLAKAGSVMVGGAIIAAIGMLTLWAVLAGVATLRDISTSGEVWSDIGWQIARATVMGTGAALAGYAATMLFRSTVATLGLLVVLTVGSSLFISLLPFAEPEVWMIHANGLAILQNGYEYWPMNGYEDCWNGCESEMQTLGLWRGVTYFVVILGAVAAASMTAFRRRDVP